MKKSKYKITPIKQDIILIDLAGQLKVDDSTLSKLTKKYNLGFTRSGAGNYHYLTKRDIKVITEYFKLKKKQAEEWIAYEKKWNLKKIAS